MNKKEQTGGQMNKFTPGPWVHEHWNIVSMHPDFKHSLIARVASGEDAEMEKANAKVLGATLELLAACQMVVERWECGDLAGAAQACQSAIEQATT